MSKKKRIQKGGSSSDPPFWSFVSGVTAGGITQFVFTPADFLRVRLQASGRGKYANSYVLGVKEFLRTSRAIYQKEGLFSFFTGVKQGVLGASLSWGVYFYLYNAVKYRLEERKGGELTAKDFLVASTLSGLISSTLMHPIWLIKTRIQLNSTSLNMYRYTSGIDCVRSIVRSSGVRGLFVGLPASLLMSSHGVVFFVLYDSFKQAYFRKSGKSELGGIEAFGLSAVAKVFSNMVSHPFSVTKTRVQDQKNFYHDVKYSGIFDAMLKMWRAEGFLTFYRGFLLQLVKSVPSGAVTLFFYEMILNFVRRRHGYGYDPEFSLLVAGILRVEQHTSSRLGSREMSHFGDDQMMLSDDDDDEMDVNDDNVEKRIVFHGGDMEDDSKMDEDNDFDEGNFNVGDMMDTSLDGEEKMTKFGDGLLNIHNKRIRPEHFQESIDEEEVEALPPFVVRPKFRENEIRPFSSELSQLPGYRRPNINEIHPFNNQQQGGQPYLQDEDAQERFRQYVYEKDKEEIRQIMRINKLNKKKSVEDHKKIDIIGTRQFHANVFTQGKRDGDGPKKLIL